MEKFDLAVIGAGPGGFAAAIRGAQLGASVAIVESDKWGGLCLNRACIPTKFLAAVSERAALFTADNQGFKKLNEAPELDPAVILAQKDTLTGYFSMGTRGLLAGRGVRCFSGEGRLAGPGRISVGGDTMAVGAIVIACGTEWGRPAIPGGDLEEVIDTSRFLSQGNLPKRALFLGGGPWQLELAQFVIASGGSAAIIEKDRNILPGWERDLGQRLRSIINKEPLAVFNQAEALSFTKKRDGIRVDARVKDKEHFLTVDRIIHLERRPLLAKLGLDTVGLQDLSVNSRCETKADHVYAVGDATGTCGWSHLSTAQGIAAAENALGRAERSIDPKTVPKVCFTRPQAASVGLSEAEAIEAGYETVTGEAPMGVNPMAMIQGQSNGVLKVVGEKRYGQILGVHVLAPMATEIIGQGVLAIQMEATLEELARAVLPHPSIGESLGEAARDALGWPLFQPK